MGLAQLSGAAFWFLVWTLIALGAAWVILPLSLGLLVGLRLVRDDRNAAAFLTGASLCLGLTIIGKLGFMIMGGVGSVTSPSGHAALSTYFYTAVGFLAVAMRPSAVTRSFATALVSLAAVITLSRFIVAGHSRAETLLGQAFGAFSFVVFLRRAERRSRDVADIAKVALTTLFVAGLLVGFARKSIVEEDEIRDFARAARARIICFAGKSCE